MTNPAIKWALLLLLLATGGARHLACDEVKVRYEEGVSRGFMVLRGQDGNIIADGQNSQIVKNGIVTNHLTFRFKDGSLYDDTTTFTQHGTFHLLKDHVIQKGPSFKTQMESTLDASKGQVTVDYKKGDKPEHLEQTLSLPPDLVNGLTFTVAKNMLSEATATVSYLALTPKPRVVKLIFTREGQQRVRTGEAFHEAVRFNMKVDIPGMAGVAASVLGKKPPDTHMWFVGGEAPSYAGSQGPLYGDGPVWKIELVSPRPPE